MTTGSQTTAGNPLLPQYMPDAQSALMQKALANKLLERGFSGSNLQPSGGGYQHVPKYGIGNALSDMASTYGGMRMQQQANQSLADVYMRQMQALTGQSAPQLSGQGLIAPQGAMTQPPQPQTLGFGYGSGLGQGLNPYVQANATEQLGQGFGFR